MADTSLMYRRIRMGRGYICLVAPFTPVTMNLKELTQKKQSPGEKSWIRLFGWIGVLMFIAGTFESLVTLFWIGKAVVPMDDFRIGFAAGGFAGS